MFAYGEGADEGRNNQNKIEGRVRRKRREREQSRMRLYVKSGIEDLKKNMAGINVYLRKKVPRMLSKMLNLLRNMTGANNDVTNGVDSYLVSCDNVILIFLGSASQLVDYFLVVCS